MWFWPVLVSSWKYRPKVSVLLLAQSYIQGVSTRYVTLWSPRWPTKIDLQVLKKVAAHSGGLDILVNKVIFVIKLINSRTWLTHKNSVVIFRASVTYAASLTSAALETSMASTTLKILFHQKNFLILMISFPLVPKVSIQNFEIK